MPSAALWAIAAAIAFHALCSRKIAMALRQSTIDIIAKIEAIKAGDQAAIDAAVTAANAAKDVLIASDQAEDQEQVDAINKSLTVSPHTPDPVPVTSADPSAGTAATVASADPSAGTAANAATADPSGGTAA